MDLLLFPSWVYYEQRRQPGYNSFDRKKRNAQWWVWTNRLNWERTNCHENEKYCPTILFCSIAANENSFVQCFEFSEKQETIRINGHHNKINFIFNFRIVHFILIKKAHRIFAAKGITTHNERIIEWLNGNQMYRMSLDRTENALNCNWKR